MAKVKQKWIKVNELKKGMKIAVPTSEALGSFGFGQAEDIGQEREKDVLWDEIVSIKKVGEERVYDIEVAGTHNFVAGNMIGQGRGKWYGGIYAHNTYLEGNATTTGSLVVGTATGEESIGDVNISGSYLTNGADYAEYFWTEDTDLEPGEVVSVDITKENAVKRSERERDPNVIGIVSSNPAIIGNTEITADKKALSQQVIIGLLGQVPAKASIENGVIRPGDSLTSAIRPGYLMRADSGDSTVGVALEGLETEEGVIKVLISRRNKSLTVEQVEEKVQERIASMEIEDEVNLMVAGALNNLGVEGQIDEMTLRMADMGRKLIDLETRISAASTSTPGVVLSQALIQGTMQVGESLRVEGDSYFGGSVNFSQGSLGAYMRIRALEEADISEMNLGLDRADEAGLEQLDLSLWQTLPETGDVVVVDPRNSEMAVKSYQPNANAILGVVTARPAAVLSGTAIASGQEASQEARTLAISGNVAIKVTLENGPIKKGDLLTTAAKPGYAMKATLADAGIIGIALEDYTAEIQNQKSGIQILLSIANKTVHQRGADLNDILSGDEQLIIDDSQKDGQVAVVDAGELLENKGEVSVRPVTEYGGDLAVAGIVTIEQGLVVHNVASIIGELKVEGKVVVKGDIQLSGNLDLAGAIITEFDYASSTMLLAGDAVGINEQGQVVKVRADIPLDSSGDNLESTNYLPAIGIVVGPSQGSKVKVAIGGVVGGFNNLEIGQRYYLADSLYEAQLIAGLVNNQEDEIILTSLMPVKPKYYGQMAQIVGIAKSSSEILIMPSLDFEIIRQGAEKAPSEIDYPDVPLISPDSQLEEIKEAEQIVPPELEPEAEEETDQAVEEGAKSESESEDEVNQEQAAESSPITESPASVEAPSEATEDVPSAIEVVDNPAEETEIKVAE